MHKFQITVENKNIEVWLDVNQVNQQALLQYSEYNKTFVDWLQSSRGAFGHILGNRTTPIDLDYAMQSLGGQQFKPKRLEGEIDSYNPDIADDAVT